MSAAFRTADGAVLCVRDGVLVEPAAGDDVIDVGDGSFHPGLINAHDHLHRNHYGRLGHPPYADAYAWGRDIHEHCRADIERARLLDRADALRFGALRNLLGAVTTAVHHDTRHALLDEPLFPLHVPHVRWAHSPGFDDEGCELLRGAAPACVHLAEGVNADAAGEVHMLAQRGLLCPGLLAVHLTGADEDGVALLRQAGAAAVWCPSSNAFLFGRQPPRALFESGIDILLGTDSLLTGAGTMLDELRAARATGLLDDGRLRAAVGCTAARRLHLHPPSLAPGSPADFVLLRSPLLACRSADVALVVCGGRIVLADASIPVRVDGEEGTVVAAGVRKRVPAELARALARALALNPDCAPFLQ